MTSCALCRVLSLLVDDKSSRQSETASHQCTEGVTGTGSQVKILAVAFIYYTQIQENLASGIWQVRVRTALVYTI